jgi:hypothetical protein
MMILLACRRTLRPRKDEFIFNVANTHKITGHFLVCSSLDNESAATGRRYDLLRFV